MQRLGKNLVSYLGEVIDIRVVLRDIELAAQQFGWTLEVFHTNGEFRWFALHRAPLPGLNPQIPARIYLSAGIHGDEPAGPVAVLRLIRENQWPANADVYLCPCLNPIGFTLNKRENGRGIDLNRDYLHLQSTEVAAHIAWLEQQSAFAVSFCLHEDWESHGFYVYELNPDHKSSLAEAIVAGVAKACPIDPSEIIEGREAKAGIIRPNLDPRSRPQWPEAFWLLTHKTRLSYTLEAPSDFALSVRVNALVQGVRSALACLLLKSPPAE